MEDHKTSLYKDIESSSNSSETTGFLGGSKPTRQRNRLLNLHNARSVFELFLVGTFVFLFASGSIHRHSPGSARYGPQLPRKDVILGNAAGLGPNIEYNNHEMLWNATEMNRIHRNWQQLFPKGRGYVKLEQNEGFKLLHPAFAMDDVLVPGDHYEGHILAVYHQLHCLSILVTSMGTSRQEWQDMNPRIREHRSHCVEYLRQSILCNADTTAEGETGSWTKSTGWGQTHSCVDFEALTEYSNERAIWDLTDQLLPENFDFKKADVDGKPRSEVDESKFNN
ncbi:hypothetical protein BGZ60DRAFT_528569 [Tricladium varicosporioides]|nr:hypothetical protein BGZ60DRAFT_528569 [Hymenoscyphus varicosporioides]